MSNVQHTPDDDSTHLEELYVLLKKMSQCNRAFGCEVNFNGSEFHWLPLVHDLKADEIELTIPEKRLPGSMVVPTVPMTAHRKH